MKINQNHIYGGNQQFADTIINNHSILSEADKKIIDLIDADGKGVYNKQVIAEDIEKLKSPNTNSEEKEKAKGALRKIFESGLSQLTKGAIKALIDQNAEYLNF